MYSEKEQIMNLFKNQASYLVDLVTRELETNKKLPIGLRNFRWETNLKEIIETLNSQISKKSS